MRILQKSKRSSPPHPQVAALISTLLGTRNEDLAKVLSEIDSWKWPRSDLNTWIKVLNKFDDIFEDIISTYTLNDIQLDTFAPQSKELLSAILRFERLLLENSTNRKLFHSYDRLNSLLCCEDLDIVILALNLLLRPAQQYSNQPSVTQALSISTSRLESLIKRWPQLRDHGVSLVNLARPASSSVVDALQPEARQVNFTFYRMAPPQTADKDTKKMDTDAEVPPAAVPSGPVVVQIDEQTLASKPVMHILKDVIETHTVPEKDRFELMCRIRAAKVMLKGNEADREKYVIVRLLAIAIFGHTHGENHTSSLFLYEPDVINHIAELLQSDADVSIPVQTAAIAALDALSRYRNKTQEILTAVNAGVNHGILMALVRKTVADVANPESTTPHSFVEALLSFITYIATHIAGGNMVVGAGLVPLLIQVIDNKLPIRLPMVSKAMQLIDNVLYNFANAFQVFCSARGVEVLVNRIEYEIDFDLESHGNRPGVQDVSGCGELPVARAAILKHTLRSLNRMMQSSGTAEGLRGLIDSSILKSIKKVIQYRGLFGPSVLPIAINIMSTFIHNEPTSLPTIQESGLPETFYRAIEGGLEASIEASVIQAIPNAIGALCLNEAGQKQLASRPSIIPTIFSIFVSERHLKVLLDKENAVLMGTAIDELIRHHPSLKGIIFDSLKSVMTKIEDMGNAWKPEGDFAKWYALTSKKEVEIEEVLMVDSELETLPTGDQDVTMDDGQENTPAAQAIVEEPLDDPKLESDEASKRPHDNQIVSFIDTINRFLEGLFQHPPHCKDFVSLVGLGALGRISSLPCLPYDFASSVASDSMVQVMRTLAEICTTETVQHLMMLVRSSLDETNDFWHVVGGTESKLFALVEFSENDSEERNRQFRRLIALHIRITLLSDVFATASYAHGRAAIALLQTLMSDQGPNILPDLGALHRAALCENLLFKTAINTNGIDVAPTPVSASFPGSPFHGVDALPTTDGMATANGVSPTPENVNIDEPSSGRISAKADESRQRNASSVKHISHGLPAALAPFFQALVKTFHSRRNPDPAQKQQISRASKLLADVLMQHISQSDIGNKVTTYSYYSLVFGLITSLLVDERQSSTSLHTVALVAFYDAGGFEAVSTICHELVASIAEISLTKVEDRSESQKQELLHAQGALKIALHLILPVISSKHLFESGQTLLITTPDKKDTDPGYFEPHNFLVKLRVSVVELLASLWEADCEWGE
ncbi:hypothetical protein ONZ45_g15389 [Pleurotus djamor]|nr:hypothetical protein ONZ45_g15389 [Pleurotus djamor]